MRQKQGAVVTRSGRRKRAGFQIFTVFQYGIVQNSAHDYGRRKVVAQQAAERHQSA